MKSSHPAPTPLNVKQDSRVELFLQNAEYAREVIYSSDILFPLTNRHIEPTAENLSASVQG